MSRKTRSSGAVVGRLVPAAVGVAALVTFIVGLGTGVATIVKWVNTPTVVDAINAVSPWAGPAGASARTPSPEQQFAEATAQAEERLRAAPRRGGGVAVIRRRGARS